MSDNEINNGTSGADIAGTVSKLQLRATDTRAVNAEAERRYLEGHHFPMPSWANLSAAKRQRLIESVLDDAYYTDEEAEALAEELIYKLRGSGRSAFVLVADALVSEAYRS